jgi:hypothetical protein
MSSTLVPSRGAALKGNVFNQAVTANTNIFTHDLYPSHTPISYFLIYGSFAAAGLLKVKRTKAGSTTTTTEILNTGRALEPNSPLTFLIGVSSSESINIQYSTSTTALKLIVVEHEDVASSLSSLSGGSALAEPGPTAEGSGVTSFNGDGATKAFAIPHGLGGAPSSALVSPATADATGSFYVSSLDATNITVTYGMAPRSGTGNVTLNWSAFVGTGGTQSFDGDGTTKVFSIPHGLTATPTTANVTPATADACGSFFLTLDSTNINVNYGIAPRSGTANVAYYYRATP